MSQKNQILDVSYGTFSCRLEGFEDSVATMKTVVSYFHDLAGHNRFMDMAPQAPDMDTLAQLTEEQAGTAVEIEGTGQNVSLRAAFAEPVATAHDDVADDGWDEDEDDEDPISLTADDDEEDESEYADGGAMNITQDDYEEDYDDDFEDDVEPVAAEADVDDFEEDDSIAAKLQRIRAVVGRGHVSATPASTPAVSSILDLDEDDDDEDDKPNPLALRLAELAKRNAEVTAAAQQDTVADEDDAFDEDMDAFAGDLTEDATTDHTDTVEDDAEDSPLVLSTTPHDPTDAFEFDAADADDDEADVEDDVPHSKRDELTQNVDSAMSRILSETDAQLNTPEGRRHRGAFAQLKAAVAATEAARQMGDKDPTVDKDEPFREDLSAHDAEERSEARDSAPLRLVQPLPAASDSRPLDHAAERLRRIASMKEQSHGPAAGGFAEFAAEQGVTELGDLLEAAAAYIAFVEGDEDFSRPQVMKKVQMASSEEISREDGLRSFGRLLRQSKILKLDNGRFQVAENTRFRPDQTA